MNFRFLILALTWILCSCGSSNPLSHTILSYDSSSKTLSVQGQDASSILYVSGTSSDIQVKESADGPVSHTSGVVNLSISSAGEIQLGSINISGNLTVGAGKSINVGGAINALAIQRK